MATLAELQLEVAALQQQRAEDAQNMDAFFSMSMALFVIREWGTFVIIISINSCVEIDHVDRFEKRAINVL